MKAIVTKKYGPAAGLELEDVARPSPGDREVLVRVHASTVTAGDVMLRRLRFPVSLLLRLFVGVRRKRTPGHELAGEITAVGKDVTQFKNGDEVFGTTTGLSVGANAEYVCLPEQWADGVLALKPTTVPYEEAAAIPVGGMAALYLLKKANVGAGQRVLINGASGSVGSYGVQLAKHFGADVTGVCSTRNVDLVRSLGADHVIDYTQEDFTETDGAYDIIFDAVGKTSQTACRDVLAEDGVFVTVQSTTRESTETLLLLRDLAEAGELTPVIDRRYPLDQVAAAHQYVEGGHKRGNVVIAVTQRDG